MKPILPRTAVCSGLVGLVAACASSPHRHGSDSGGQLAADSGVTMGGSSDVAAVAAGGNAGRPEASGDPPSFVLPVVVR